METRRQTGHSLGWPIELSRPCAQKGVPTFPDSSYLECLPRLGIAGPSPRGRHPWLRVRPLQPAWQQCWQKRRTAKKRGSTGQMPQRAGRLRHAYQCLQEGRAFQKAGRLPGRCEARGLGAVRKGLLPPRNTAATPAPAHLPAALQVPFLRQGLHLVLGSPEAQLKPYSYADCSQAFVGFSEPRKQQRNMHSNNKLFLYNECCTP